MNLSESTTTLLLLAAPLIGTGLVADRLALASTENGRFDGEAGRRGGATLRPNSGPVEARRPREHKRACDVMPCVYCPREHKRACDVKSVRARKSLTRPKVVCQ